MAPLTQTCVKCQKQFLVIDPEQQFLREKGIPLPTECPQCRQDRRLALRGGRKLYRTKCQVCGKDIVVSYDPDKAESTILCREDWEKYQVEHEYLITDPLPGDSTPIASSQTQAPAQDQQAVPTPAPAPQAPIEQPAVPEPAPTPTPVPTPQPEMPTIPVQAPPQTPPISEPTPVPAPAMQPPAPAQNLFQSPAPTSAPQPSNDPISNWAQGQPTNPQEPEQ